MAYIYTTVDVDVDIEVDEFLKSCNERDIKTLIKLLVENGHMKTNDFHFMDTSKMSANEIEFNEKINYLASKYYSMNNEECETIEKLYQKYR